MGSLGGQSISNTYGLLLKVSTTGVDTTLRTVEDGDGNDSALQVSSTGIGSSGLLAVTGATTLSSLALTGSILSNITVGVDGTGHDVRFFGDSPSSYLHWDQLNDSLILTDSTPLKIGDGGDMQIYHNGSHSFITNSTGTMKLATESSGIAVSIGHTVSETTVNDNLTVTGDLTAPTLTGNVAIAGDLTVSGNDIVYGAASAASLKVLAATGTDQAGGILTIAGGQGTGSGAGGNIVFQVAETGGGSGSGVNSLATVMTLSGGTSDDGFGKVDIGASQLALTNDSATEINFTGASTANITSAGDIIMKAASGKLLKLGANDQDDSLKIDASENVFVTGGYLKVDTNWIEAPYFKSSTGMIMSNPGSADIWRIASPHDTVGYHTRVYGGNTTAGTTNNVGGGDLTLGAGKGKGSGPGGDIIFQVSTAAGSGSTLNALATAMTLAQDKKLTLVSDLTVGGNSTFNGQYIYLGHTSPQIQTLPSAHDTPGYNIAIHGGDTTAGTTNNIAGGDVSITGGQGKGSGQGGDIIFQVAPAGSSGSTLNSLETALTVAQNKSVTCASTCQSTGFYGPLLQSLPTSDLTLGATQNVVIHLDSDQAATATAAKLIVKNGSGTEVAEVDEQGDLQMDGELTVAGTNTSSFAGIVVEGRTVIKVPPTAFMSNEEGSLDLNYTTIDDSGSNKGLRISDSDCEIYAYVDVPLGYTATKVRIYGSASPAAEVYTLDLTDGTIGSEISNVGLQVNGNLALASNHVGSDSNLLFIKVLTTAVSEIIYGAIVTIEQT